MFSAGDEVRVPKETLSKHFGEQEFETGKSPNGKVQERPQSAEHSPCAARIEERTEVYCGKYI
jgi:hypothetical protein